MQEKFHQFNKQENSKVIQEDLMEMYIASESSLSKDWCKEEEKKVWENISKNKFLKSYNKSDEIYNQI